MLQIIPTKNQLIASRIVGRFPKHKAAGIQKRLDSPWASKLQTTMDDTAAIWIWKVAAISAKSVAIPDYWR